MSGSVGTAISKSDMAENVGVAVEIELPSLSVQTLFPLAVCIAALLSSRRRPTSGHAVRCRLMSAVIQAGRSWSRMCSLLLESRRYSLSFKNCFYFRPRVRHFEYRLSADVGQRRQWQRQVGRSLKHEGRRSNVDDISLNYRETMHLWFSRCFRNKSSCFRSRDRRPECHMTTALAPP